MDKMQLFRAKIDTIDDMLIELVNRRFSICRDVADYKKEISMPMMQPSRVAEVLQKVEDHARQKGLPEGVASAIYRPMISAICEMENDIIDS